jgi:hypothetical protein
MKEQNGPQATERAQKKPETGCVSGGLGSKQAVI